MGALAAVGCAWRDATVGSGRGCLSTASSWAQWAVRVDCGLSSLPKSQKTVARTQPTDGWVWNFFEGKESMCLCCTDSNLLSESGCHNRQNTTKFARTTPQINS